MLLLDEPLGALDAKLRKHLQLELQAVQREVGITFVYVTHDQEEALTMSDRLAVMRDGRVEQVGPPEAVYAAPETAYVAGFLGSANIFDADVLEVGRRFGGVLGAVRHAASGARRRRPAARGVGPAAIVIRPERITLQARTSRSGRGATYPRPVVEVVYLGPSTHVHVDVGDGRRAWSSRCPTTAGRVRRLRPPGCPVQLRVPRTTRCAC